MTYTTIEDIDHFGILSSYFKLSPKMSWLESSKGKQTGLQYAEGEDPFLSSVGRLQEGRKEEEYSLINDCFKDSVFEEIIVKYKLVRTRLMWINERSCYSIHKDQTKRLHIPLVTNEQCKFVFPDIPELVYLKTGKVYIVDTTLNHSFANFSDKARLHLVGCVL